MNKLAIIILILFVAMAVGLGGCVISNPPTPSPEISPAAPAPTPEESIPEPDWLAFTKLSPVKDSMGNLYFLGFVSNEGQGPIFHGVITLELYDEKGTTIVGTDEEQFFSILSPGDKLPISFKPWPQPVSWGKYELSSRVSSAGTDLHLYTEVVIAEYAVEGGELWCEIKAKLTNTGQSIAHDICVWAAGYNKGGELVTLGRVISGMITGLEPDQSILFELHIFEGDVSEAETWEFYIKAWSE